MLRRLWLVPALAGLLAAQSAPNQRLVILKYADPQAVSNLLRQFGGSAMVNPELHALAIKAPPEEWPGIEDAIRKLDTPAALPKDIEVAIYFLIGGDQTGEPLPAPPAALQPMVSQLTKAYSFRNFGLADLLVIRVRNGEPAEASGSVGASGPPVVTQTKIKSAAVSGDGSTIRLDRFSAGMRLPSPNGPKGETTFLDTGITTDLDLPAGRDVLVGRCGVSAPRQALFVVVSAKAL